MLSKTGPREYIVILKTSHAEGKDEFWAVQLQVPSHFDDAKKAAQELVEQNEIDGQRYNDSQVVNVIDISEVPYLRAQPGFKFSAL